MSDESGLRLGSFAGAPIIIEPAFLLLGAYVLGSAVLDGGVAALPSALVYLAVLVVAVLIHEIGHAAAAAALKIPSKRIVLTFFGGYLQFAWQPRKRWHEIVVAAAGPFANLATFALLYAANVQFTGIGFFANLAFVSLILGALNLLPGFPLDGGHIVRAALSYVMPRRNAAIVAALIGLALAIAIGAFSLIAQLWWTLMVAALLALAAWAELTRARSSAQEPPSSTSNA